MKKLISIAFAAAMLTVPVWTVTPAQAMTMEECLAKHSQGYCDAALSTESIASHSYGQADPCDVKRTTLLALAC